MSADSAGQEKRPHWLPDIFLGVERVESPAPDVSIYRVSYPCEGLSQRGYLAVSADFPDPSLNSLAPVVGFVYLRGGIGRVGMVKSDWLVRFARRNAIVFAPSYRGNDGGEGREDFGLHDRADAFCAVRALASVPALSGRRVAVYGFSRGGPLALFCAMEPHLPVCCAISHGGVADLAATYEERPDLRRMLRRIADGTPEKNPQAYRDRSPIGRVRDIRVPVLILHGTADRQVGVSQARNLLDALRETDVPHEAFMIEGAGHHLEPLVFEAATDRMFDWIKGADSRFFAGTAALELSNHRPSC